VSTFSHIKILASVPSKTPAIKLPRLNRASTFFFQAEDGIRDDLVTGVQTCALPISSPPLRKVHLETETIGTGRMTRQRECVIARSEERRVGKECRYWWSP